VLPLEPRVNLSRHVAVYYRLVVAASCSGVLPLEPRANLSRSCGGVRPLCNIWLHSHFICIAAILSLKLVPKRHSALVTVHFSCGTISAMAEPAQKKAKSERVVLFSSESAKEGRSDKVGDTSVHSAPKNRKIAYQVAPRLSAHEIAYKALFGVSVRDQSDSDSDSK
jgi:hypothetical protein